MAQSPSSNIANIMSPELEALKSRFSDAKVVDIVDDAVEGAVASAARTTGIEVVGTAADNIQELNAGAYATLAVNKVQVKDEAAISPFNTNFEKIETNDAGEVTMFQYDICRDNHYREE